MCEVDRHRARGFEIATDLGLERTANRAEQTDRRDGRIVRTAGVSETTGHAQHGLVHRHHRVTAREQEQSKR